MYCTVGESMVQCKVAVSVDVLKLGSRQSSAADNVCVVHIGHCGEQNGTCRCCARGAGAAHAFSFMMLP